MSSSRSGQWMPRPWPINRQRPRSATLPWRSRGYQASGAEIERPSDNSTVSVSSVTATCVAVTDRASAVEVLMPSVQSLLPVPLDDRLDLADLVAGEPPAPLQPDGVEPELRLAVVAFDMDVRRL